MRCQFNNSFFYYEQKIYIDFQEPDIVNFNAKTFLIILKYEFYNPILRSLREDIDVFHQFHFFTFFYKYHSLIRDWRLDTLFDGQIMIEIIDLAWISSYVVYVFITDTVDVNKMMFTNREALFIDPSLSSDIHVNQLRIVIWKLNYPERLLRKIKQNIFLRFTRGN